MAERQGSGPEGPLLVHLEPDLSDPERFRTSDDRRLGRVAECRYGSAWSVPRTSCSWLVPLDSRAKGQGHGRQERQGHSEARQVRLHNTTSMVRIAATTPATGRSSGGRSLALRPHLATGLPWTVAVTKRTSLLSRTVRDVRHGHHAPEVPIRAACRVSAATHRPMSMGPDGAMSAGRGTRKERPEGRSFAEPDRVGGDPVRTQSQRSPAAGPGRPVASRRSVMASTGTKPVNATSAPPPA